MVKLLIVTFKVSKKSLCLQLLALFLYRTHVQLSAIGSKDDMSIAFIYDIDALQVHISDFIRYQINLVTNSINATDSRREKLTQKLLHVEITERHSEKGKIEADYVHQDIERAKEGRTKLLLKHDALMQQLSLSISKDLCENGEAK